VAEIFPTEADGVGADGRWIEGGFIGFEAVEGAAEIGDGLMGEVDTGGRVGLLEIDDGFEDAAFAEGDDGAACSLGFDGGHAEVFFTRENEGATAAHVVANGFVGLATKESDVGGTRGKGAEAVRFRAFTDDEQLARCAEEGLDGEVDTFVGDEGGDDEVEVVGIGRGSGQGEGGDIDAGVDDAGVAAVDAFDALGDILGVGDERVDAVILQIELLEVRTGGEESGAFEGPAFEILIFHAPDVAHGGVAIAEMLGAAGDGDAFGDAMAGGNYEVTIVELDGFDGGREGGEEAAVERADAGEIIEGTDAGDAFFDFRIDGAGDVEEGGYFGLGEHVDELKEDFFAAAHAG